MAEGLSIANNLLADQVQLNLDVNQGALTTLTNQLSSGLRINSAADDPSGLTIATSLQTQTGDLNTASQNVQTANNAAQVALGALSTTTDILQRIRSLAVEAASDINSESDRENLQAEVTQLLLEVNRIAQDTNFNGQTLLDGSHAGFQAEQNAFLTITANSALATNGGTSALSGVNYGLLVATVTGANANFNTTPNANIEGVQGFVAAAAVVDGNFEGTPVPTNTIQPVDTPVPAGWTASGAGAQLFNGSGGSPPLPPGVQGVLIPSTGALSQTLTGLTPGTSYQLTITAGSSAAGQIQVLANGVLVLPVTGLTPSYLGYTTESFVAPASGVVTFSLNNLSKNPLSVSNVSITTEGATVDGTIEIQVVNTGVSIAAQETFINSASGQICVSPTLFGPDSSSDAFDNTSVTLGDFTAADVGTTSYIKVSQNVAALTNPDNPAFNIQSAANEGDVVQVGILAANTQTLRISNINLTISAAGNPSIGAEDAIGQIDNALQRLLNQQAVLGAVVVRLNEDADNDNGAAVNLQASESSIRDLNVAQATTEFTRLQVLVQVGTSVLAQVNANAQSVLGLFR